MYCKFCGSMVDDDARFCASCGRGLSSDPVPAFTPTSTFRGEPIIFEQPAQKIARPSKSVSFGQAIKNYYTNYANFSGRAVRSEYWYVFLYETLVAIVFLILSAPLAVSFAWDAVHLIPGIALCVRRFHDVGKSGGYWWLCLLPIVGGIICIYYMCCDSDYDNAWGLSPYDTPGYNSTPKKQFEGYSAVTRSATHTWRCECGANISVSPCPYCGRQHIYTVSSEEDLKNYMINEIKENRKPPETIAFYQKYLNCMYNVGAHDVLETLQSIIADAEKYLRYDSAHNSLQVMLNVCDKKLRSIGFMRCKGCGKIVPADTETCECGYPFSLPQNLSQCKVCGKMAPNLSYCEIKDAIGTRNRWICRDCETSLNATVIRR